MGIADCEIETPNLSDNQLAAMLGNSMSCNILERLLARALCSANLAKWADLALHWEDLDAAEAFVPHLRKRKSVR